MVGREEEEENDESEGGASGAEPGAGTGTGRAILREGRGWVLPGSEAIVVDDDDGGFNVSDRLLLL